MYADGGGLCLRVTPQGARSWVLRYMLDRKPHWMGLGPLGLYGLADARARALDARKKRHDGIDPIEARRAERARQRLGAAKAITFKQCAESYVTAHRAGWRNGKHAAQWSATLSTYAYPVLGALPVQSVDTGLILKVLEGIWTAKPETASRLRGRAWKALWTEFGWSGAAKTHYWVDPKEELVGLFMPQSMMSFDRPEFDLRALAYQAIED